MHYVGTGITPAMTHAAPGIGSQYAYTVDDANGDTLDGAKNYTLTLPAPIPVKTFWAIDIYDTQTRSLLQTDNPYPSINDRFGDLHTEANGDVVIHFGPEPPPDDRRQLAADHPRQELVPDPAPLRPTRSLVRPDLATRRDPTRLAAPGPPPLASEQSGRSSSSSTLSLADRHARCPAMTTDADRCGGAERPSGSIWSLSFSIMGCCDLILGSSDVF